MEGSFVAITNASSGIGQELARQFGSEKLELLICSASDEIFTIQNELELEGHTVEAMKVNLATSKGVEIFCHRIRNFGKRLDTLVINTEFKLEGNFLDNELKKDIKSINNNILSNIHLLKIFLAEMVEREEGNILFSLTSSSNAVESASITFIQSLITSLRKET
jgi:short-subunit dehydrogenase